MIYGDAVDLLEKYEHLMDRVTIDELYNKIQLMITHSNNVPFPPVEPGSGSHSSTCLRGSEVSEWLFKI